MKKIGVLFVILFVLVAVLSFGKNFIAQNALSAGVKAITGLELSTKRVNVGVFKTLIGVKGLKIFNPAGFADNVMLDMPEIYIDYDLGAFLRKKVHLEEVRLNLKEITVVKNTEGQLNLDSLNVAKEKQPAGQAQPKQESKMPEFQIDLLIIDIGKVIYKDYSQAKPTTKEFQVNINERFENITDPKALVGLIVTKALIKTSIPQLANFDFKGTQDSLSQSFGAKAKDLKERFKLPFGE